jgi:hypothetical protein
MTDTGSPVLAPTARLKLGENAAAVYRDRRPPAQALLRNTGRSGVLMAGWNR